MMPTLVSMQARTKIMAPSPEVVSCGRWEGRGWLTVDVGAVEVAVEVVDSEDAGDEDTWHC
jgi:hypothetical protein